MYFILVVITPLGLLSKAYTGIGQQWVQDYSGDILYEIFWCLVIFWFMPTVKNLNQHETMNYYLFTNHQSLIQAFYI